MRPVRRGASPESDTLADDRETRLSLLDRLGSYCSFCERKVSFHLVVHGLAPSTSKDDAQPPVQWENLFLACDRCRSERGGGRVDFSRFLLPDRDNTFVAFTYTKDGAIRVDAALVSKLREAAENTLTSAGLDRNASQLEQANERYVAWDLAAERMETRLLAVEAKNDVDAAPDNDAVKRWVVRNALEKGFFSIWMAVFEEDLDMRRRLISAFRGTADSECFDPATTKPRSPAPNPDSLPFGGKI